MFKHKYANGLLSFRTFEIRDVSYRSKLFLLHRRLLSFWNWAKASNPLYNNNITSNISKYRFLKKSINKSPSISFLPILNNIKYKSYIVNLYKLLSNNNNNFLPYKLNKTFYRYFYFFNNISKDSKFYSILNKKKFFFKMSLKNWVYNEFDLFNLSKSPSLFIMDYLNLKTKIKNLIYYKRKREHS